MLSKPISFRFRDEHSDMLKRIAGFYGRSQSDILRMLIEHEGRRVEAAQARNGATAIREGQAVHA